MNDNFDFELIKKKVCTGLFFILAAFTLFFVFSDIGKIVDVLQRVNYYYILQGIIWCVCVYTGRYIKWYFYLKQLCIELPMQETAKIFFCGLSMAITPGKAGEVIKSYLLKLKYGIDFSRTASTIIVERLTGMLGAAVLCFISVIVLSEVGSYIKYIMAVVFVLLLLVIISLHYNKIRLLVFGIASCIPFVKKKINILEQLYFSAQAITNFRMMSVSIMISVGYWFAECMIFNCALKSVDVNLPISIVLFILTLSAIGGGLSLMPGSVGALEGGMIGLLMLNGLNYDVAVCVTLLHRIMSMWLVVISSGAFFVYYLKKNCFLSISK